MRMLDCAWLENPSLAICFSARFQSSRLDERVRWLLLNYPEKAIGDPEGLQILLGSSLPSDVVVQLKVNDRWIFRPINTNVYSICFIGHQSILSQLLRIFYQIIETIHLYFSMRCGFWNGTLLT